MQKSCCTGTCAGFDPTYTIVDRPHVQVDVSDQFGDDTTPDQSRQNEKDLNVWLVQQLQSERAELLMHLEGRHERLVARFLSRSQQGISQSPDEKAWQSELFCHSRPRDGVGSTLEQDVAEDLALPDDASKEKVDEYASTATERSHAATVDAMLFQGLHETNVMRDPTLEATYVENIFEVFFAAMIALNTICLALDTQYRGMQIGYDLSFGDYKSPARESWPGADSVFEVLELVFTSLFTLELLARLALFRTKILLEWWSYLDFMIVIIAWLMIYDEGMFEVNPTFVRLVRFSRLLRLVHLLRSQEIFDSLKLLVASLRASVRTLFWSLCVILIIQCVAGLLMVQILEPFLLDESKNPEVQRQVFVYFGTFWRAMITMFEITFANWVPSCRVLVENVSEVYAMFYLIYRCAIGFAVLMVVQAVFIQQTMKTTQLDDAFLANQRVKAKANIVERLTTIFKKLDKSGDGFIEWDEFQSCINHQNLAAILEVFDLEVTDFHTMFELLDDGDGRISIDEFVNGVEHMKGPARAIELMQMKGSLRAIERQCSLISTCMCQPSLRTSTHSEKHSGPALAASRALWKI